MKLKTAIKSVLWRAQNGQCCYCEKPMAVAGRPYAAEATRLGIVRDAVGRRIATLEHLQRRADGGTDDPDNLALACANCNHRRGAVDWLTYKSRRLGEQVPA